MKMHELDQSVTERVTIGPDGKVTGGFKPQLSEPVPAAEPVPAPAPAPSNVKPGGATVEYGGSTYSVNVFGDGIRPRIGRSDKVVTAKAYVVGDKMYVLLDPEPKQGVAEGGFPKKISQKEVDKFQKKHNDKLTGREVNRQEQEKKPADNNKKQGVAEGSLNELSKDTLKSYGKKAVADGQASQKRSQIEIGKAASTKDDETAKTHYDAAKQAKDRTEKRMAGLNGAIKRLTKQGVAEAFENDESNMMYRFNSETGRLGQRMIHNNEEQVAHRQGYRDSHESALKVHGIIRSKFKPGKWVQKQGNSWAEVHPFGKPDGVDESATAGATSAANVGVGAVYNNKPPKQPKNKDGTAKNAVDMKGVNLLTGGSLKR